MNFAGCYAAHLLVKEKRTNKWTFPRIPLLAKSSFENGRKKLLNETLGGGLKLH